MAKHSDIAKVETEALQPLEQIENLIHVIRGKQVMLDRDLARLYGVETFRLNEQVKRNIERFPEDFMFKLTREEAESSRSQFAMLNDDSISSQNARTSNTSEILKSQIVTSSDNSSTSQIAILKGRGHNIKHLPYAFTENGVAMLSSVLRTPAVGIHSSDTMDAAMVPQSYMGTSCSCRDLLAAIHVATVRRYPAGSCGFSGASG